MKTPRVFIPEPCNRYNFATAEPYGELVFVAQRPTNPFNPDGMLQIFGTGLAEHAFDPATDFICLTGQQVAVAYFLLAACRAYGTVNTLIFDSQNGTYQLRVTDPAAGA